MSTVRQQPKVSSLYTFLFPLERDVYVPSAHLVLGLSAYEATFFKNRLEKLAQQKHLVTW